jgi:hypothetical protein
MSVLCANLPTSAPAQVPATQIKLREKHVEGFIAAQNDMLVVVEKMQGAVSRSGSANAHASKGQGVKAVNADGERPSHATTRDRWWKLVSDWRSSRLEVSVRTHDKQLLVRDQ